MWLLGKHLVSDRNFSTSERWMTPLGGSQNPQLFRVSFYAEDEIVHDAPRLANGVSNQRLPCVT